MANDIGSLLLRSGLIQPEHLAKVRLTLSQNGGTIPEALVQHGFLADEELTSFYRSRLLIPRINPSDLAKLQKLILNKIPADMALEYRSIPISSDTEGNLTVVMSDPSDTEVADEIGFFTGSYIVRAIATQAQIAWCLAHYYRQKTTFYTELVSQGKWPNSQKSIRPAINQESKKKREVSMPAIAQAAGQATKVPNRVKRPTSEGDTPDKQKKPTPKKRKKKKATKRPSNQQPSPPELFARAGEIQSTNISAEPQHHEQPAVVISLGTDAVVQKTQRGTDTSPIVLSGENQADRTVPIVLSKLRRKRRTSKNTHVGVGSISSAKPAKSLKNYRTTKDTDVQIATTLVDIPQIHPQDLQSPEAKKIELSVNDTIQGIPKALIPGPKAQSTEHDTPPDKEVNLQNLAIPVPIQDERSLGQETEFGEPSVPIPVSAQEDATEPHEQPDSITGTDSNASSSARSQDLTGRLLVVIRKVDKAQNKLEIVHPILGFLGLLFERAGFFIIKKDTLSSWKLHKCPETSKIEITLQETGTLQDVIRMRLPYNGPIEDMDTKALATAIKTPGANNILVLPIEIRERVIGVFIGLGSYSPVHVEHVSLLCRAANEAFERILLAKKK